VRFVKFGFSQESQTGRGRTEMDISRGGINIRDLDIFSKAFEDEGVIIYKTK